MPKGVFIRTKKHIENMRESRLGKHYSSSTEFTSEKTSGIKNPFSNHKHTEKSKKQQSEIKKGKPKSEEAKRRMKENAKINPNYGMKSKHHTPETIELMKEHHKGKHSGKLNGMYNIKDEDHWNWQGGKSYEPYGIKFNNVLKEQVRVRDSHTCQLCNKSQEQELLEYNNKLKIHHIDYNKKNNENINLIALCAICHAKTNFNRRYYEEYFVLFMKEKYEENNNE